jgi:hypothetical protein
LLYDAVTLIHLVSRFLEAIVFKSFV